MTWFKVDDGLHSHRKRVRAGHEAMGLWVIAGSWAAFELTDGWVPDDVVEYLVPIVGADLAKRLERAGLWYRVTRDGEEGWQFHDWDVHQPSKEKVLADRAAAADRQARARERARQKRAQQDKPQDWESEESEPSRRDSRVTNGGSHGTVTVPPTRPDPTRTSYGSSYGEASSASPPDDAPKKPSPRRGSRIPADFKVTPKMVAWARERCPGVDGRLQTELFINYWQAKAGPNAIKRDWESTWRNWMLKANELPGPGSGSSSPPGPSSAGSGLAHANGWQPHSPADQRLADAMALAARYAEEDGTPL